MKRYVFFSTAFAVLVFATSAVQASTFFSDTFSYADGDLTVYDGTGDDVSGGLWTPHSGTGFPISLGVASGQAVLKSGDPASEDANRVSAGAIGAGETWYYAALVTVNDERADTGVGLNNDYFMHFNGFRGRAYVDDPNSADPTKFTFGLSATSGGQVAKWAADLDFGTQYKIIASYAVDTGETNLWVNPVDSSSTKISDTNSGAAFTLVDGLSLRQDFNRDGGDYEVLVDSVALGDDFDSVLVNSMNGSNIPEPTSAVLALLGLVGIAASRRRVV